MTESERKQIITLFKTGMPITQIGRMLAMTPSEFRKAITELKANGKLPKVDRTVTKDKIAKAIAEGMTSSVELCETFGITEKTLKTYKSQLGIKTGRPKRNYRHCPRTLAIIEDLKDGEMTTAEIARKHQVKWQSVHKIRRKLEDDGEL
jgi:Mn-dependent DtxR family transcriptional regulator